MFELKRLSEEAIPAALEKALRYRLLNEPPPSSASAEPRRDYIRAIPAPAMTPMNCCLKR